MFVCVCVGLCLRLLLARQVGVGQCPHIVGERRVVPHVSEFLDLDWCGDKRVAHVLAYCRLCFIGFLCLCVCICVFVITSVSSIGSARWFLSSNFVFRIPSSSAIQSLCAMCD